jgi:flavin reductase (DIM6/NTAB) family NADH-FMN oxidoreductase RutF
MERVGGAVSIVATRLLETRVLSGKERYQLLTSLLVPRPIGWISSYSDAGVRNLAPFSYFAALSATPMYVGVSVGHRRAGPKDTLANVRSTRAFCVNVVTERHLQAMNATSADYSPDVDEFAAAGLTPADADHVYAPYVAACPAVLECALLKEVELEGAPNTLLIAEVMAVRLAPELVGEIGNRVVPPELLRPVGRLGSSAYALPGVVYHLQRPRAPESDVTGG